MRFIHTADWHLGRLFYSSRLIEDQKHVLDQFLEKVEELRPDAIIHAGDVYDRAVPPPDAVRLLDEVLARLTLDLKIPVIMIAGNHDSPDRLEFGSRLMADAGLHVFGSLRPRVEPVILHDEHGSVAFYPVPYHGPVQAREVFGNNDLRDHESAMAAVLENLGDAPDSCRRSVLIAHTFVKGAQVSESERPLSIGTIQVVPSALLGDFDYVALGHLHTPQSIEIESIHYSGSPLKYSFQEADQAKGFLLVEMDKDGNCETEFHSLEPRRDLKIVEGMMTELLSKADSGLAEHYLLVRLLDRGLILDAMNRLREVYPHVLHLERLGEPLSDGSPSLDRDFRKKGEAEIFRSFFKEVTSLDLTSEQEEIFLEVANNLHGREREA